MAAHGMAIAGRHGMAQAGQWGMRLAYKIYCRVEIEYKSQYSLTVDAVANCGTNSTNAASVALPAGTYQVTYASGARSAWGDDSANNGLSWRNDRVQSNVSLPQGSGDYATYEAAESAAVGLTTTLEWGGGDVIAWIWDNYCPDNRGSTTWTFDLIEPNCWAEATRVTTLVGVREDDAGWHCSEGSALWVGYFQAKEDTDCAADHADTEPDTDNPCECT